MPTNKQRREASRRHLERQLQRREEQEAAAKRRTLIATVVGTLILAVVVVVVIVMATNDSSGSKPAAAASTPSASTPSASATPSPQSKYPCGFRPDTSAAPARKVSLPSTTPPKTGLATVSVATTQGPMTFTLDRAKAPCTVANFLSLVKQRYYDNTPCHRLVTQGIFVLQCGDPTGSGSGGPGYTIPDEATGAEKYPAGTIAMARSQSADSGGSQFFIVYKDSPNLQQKLGAQQYTVFGTVAAGLPVVDKVAAGGANPANDGAPKRPIKLTTLTAK